MGPPAQRARRALKQVEDEKDQAEGGQEWGLLAAGTLLVALPLVVAFLAFQRQFIDSFMFSGVKG